MKKVRFLLLVLIMGISGVADAQLRYGISLGGVFAANNLENVQDYSLVNRSGFTGGLLLEYQFTKCGFAPDVAVMYSRQNSRLRVNGEKPMSFGRNYLMIPINLKYKFPINYFNDLFSPMIYTGYELGIRAGGGDERCPLDTRSIQSGLNLGVGFDIVNFIQLTGGYTFGIGNEVKKFQGFPNAKMKANHCNIAVSLLFDF